MTALPTISPPVIFALIDDLAAFGRWLQEQEQTVGEGHDGQETADGNMKQRRMFVHRRTRKKRRQTAVRADTVSGNKTADSIKGITRTPTVSDW